eukprot:8684229-Alexandrium_andersonii.AAC.1
MRGHGFSFPRMLRGDASEDSGAKCWRIGCSCCRPIDPGGQSSLQRTMLVHAGPVQALLIRAPQARPPQHFLR